MQRVGLPFNREYIEMQNGTTVKLLLPVRTFELEMLAMRGEKSPEGKITHSILSCH